VIHFRKRGYSIVLIDSRSLEANIILKDKAHKVSLYCKKIYCIFHVETYY
jgi:hypothetical protein